MSSPGITLEPASLPPACKALRTEVSAFLSEEQAPGRFTPCCDNRLGGFDPDFSRRLAAHDGKSTGQHSHGGTGTASSQDRPWPGRTAAPGLPPSVARPVLRAGRWRHHS